MTFKFESLQQYNVQTVWEKEMFRRLNYVMKISGGYAPYITVESLRPAPSSMSL